MKTGTLFFYLRYRRDGEALFRPRRERDLKEAPLLLM